MVGRFPGTDPAVPEPAPAVDPAVLEELVGLTIEDFSVQAGEMGYSTRVAVEDGEAYALTEDYSETRVNVAVEKMVKPLVLNPFFGYKEEDRNILSPFMDETAVFNQMVAYTHNLYLIPGRLTVDARTGMRA